MLRTILVLNVFALCACKVSVKNKEIVYDISDGYRYFASDTLQGQDSLAQVQAIYLAKNYDKDALKHLAPAILPWLQRRGVKYDSLVVEEQSRENRILELRNSNTDDAYEKIHVAFEGMPNIEDVKPLLEEVMSRYNLPVTNQQVLKCANVLVVFHNESKVGVTEMDILKHMYQRGTKGLDFATQATISFSWLERHK
jgi:hypothetical protein